MPLDAVKREREKKTIAYLINIQMSVLSISTCIHKWISILLEAKPTFVTVIAHMPINVNGETAESRVEAYKIKRDQPANTLIKFICVRRYIKVIQINSFIYNY